MRFRSDIVAGLEHDPDFLERVDQWVADASNGQPPAEEFLKRLPGIWPGEVIVSLERLEQKGMCAPQFRKKVETALRQAPRSYHASASLASSKPLEHPLDFEWFFTKTGQDVILSELRRRKIQLEGTILCLGCPTLFERGKQLMPENEFVLWDKNASSLGQISEAQALADIDLRREAFSTFAAIAAVVDPPWYNEFYRLFLWAALRNVRVGASILVSFPPEGTRPSVVHDLRELADWANNAGAQMVAHRRGCIPYRSPLFEVNALAAAGLASVPLDWRRGDLLVFRKEASVEITRPVVRELEMQWEEFRFGPVRIRVRATEGKTLSPLLRAVGKSAVLPSVSTRFPGRHLADVVTSGNRFYRTTCHATIADICRRLRSEADVEQVTAGKEKDGDGDGMQLQVSRLIAVEQHEAAAYISRTDGL